MIWIVDIFILLAILGAYFFFKKELKSEKIHKVIIVCVFVALIVLALMEIIEK